MLEPLFVLDAETLLLVDDHQAQVPEHNVPGKQTVGADGGIDFALCQIGGGGLQFLGGSEAAEHFEAHRKGLEAALERLEVLKGKDRSGRQHDHLFAVAESLE